MLEALSQPLRTRTRTPAAAPTCVSSLLGTCHISRTSDVSVESGQVCVKPLFPLTKRCVTAMPESSDLNQQWFTISYVSIVWAGLLRHPHPWRWGVSGWGHGLGHGWAARSRRPLRTWSPLAALHWGRASREIRWWLASTGAPGLLLARGRAAQVQGSRSPFGWGGLHVLTGRPDVEVQVTPPYKLQSNRNNIKTRGSGRENVTVTNFALFLDF